MSERTIIDLEIDAPAERVWRALRDPAEIKRWFGWDHDDLDAEVDMIFVSGATVDEDARTVDTGDGLMALTGDGAHATRLRVTRTTAPAGDPDAIDLGWLTFVQQLRFALERAPGEDRVAERIEAPADLPAGEEWFTTEHARGIVLASGRELLVVERDKAVLSRYGAASDAPRGG